MARLTAHLLSLVIGHPFWRTESLPHRLNPEEKDIHATIGDAIVADGNEHLAASTVCPGLVPRSDAVLQIRYDFRRNLGVDVFAILVHFNLR